MRAVRYHGAKDLRLDDNVTEPVCLPEQIKIKPAFVGICGTDLHEYSSPTFIPMPGKPHPLSKETAPVGFGHEFCGTIVEIGREVPSASSLQIGDSVAIQPTLSCGACEPCLTDHINCCSTPGFIGLSGGGGGLSDYVCVSHPFVFKLPSSVPLRLGALVEPLSVAWHAVSAYPDFRPGTTTTLVLGAGPIGLAIILCLRALGATTIVVSEPSPSRQSFARKFGATHILNPITDDIVALSREICQSVAHNNTTPTASGPHLTLDTAGHPTTVNTALLSTRPLGTIINVAIWESSSPSSKLPILNPNLLVFGEKTYLGVLGYTRRDFQDVVNALGDGRLDIKVVEEMVTKVVGVGNVVGGGGGKEGNEKVQGKGLESLGLTSGDEVKVLVDLGRGWDV